MITDTQTSLDSNPAVPLSTFRGFRHVFAKDSAYNVALAINNDDNATSTILVTDRLAARGAIPTLIRAVEVMSPVAGSPDSMVFYANAVLGDEFYAAQERIIRATVTEVLGRDPKWPINAVPGVTVSTILSEAQSYGADLLLTGIHHHGLFEQALGENTATRIMSRAEIPVLGIRAGTAGLPRRIMVATDFGNASVEAAHLAANLVDPDGVVVLVHVAYPVAVIEEGDEGAALVQRVGIAQAFSNLCAEISEGKRIRVETVTRIGDPSTQLLAAAEQIGPDMIATASQRHRLLTRLMLGSVSRKLVRDGHWSTLITPPLRAEDQCSN